MIAQNSFSSGLNQDVAKSKMPNTAYLDALNIRIITNESGQSSYTLQNVQGNSLSFTLPTVRRMYKIAVNQTGPYAIGNFTLATQSSVGTFTPSVNTSGQDIYDFLDNDANLTLFGTAYSVAVGSTYVIIYSTGSNPAPAFSGLGLTISITTIDQINAVPIGFGTIRDDIYLFTTNNRTANPGGHDPNLTPDASSVGQIWRLILNEEFKVATPTLIYNGFLDFSVQNPIPFTAVEGVYETQNIQRLYWSDNFNQLRSINVADPNAMAIPPELLNVNPPVKYSIPRLKNIESGGILKVGVYQAAYMLRNTGGAITNYSELSNLVNIIPESEETFTGGARFKEYVGANQGTVTGKAITWIFDDLDTNFDIIDIVVIKRESLNGTIEIMKVAEEPIPANGYIEYTYSGNEDIFQIDLNTFTSIASNFTHCKTLRQKDSRLFVGNVRNLYSDIDFEARAFRFDNTNQVDIIENGVTNTYNLASLGTIDEESDAINPDQYTFKYQSDGVTLGGEGLNVKYTFGTIAIKADSTIANAVTSTGSDYRHTNPDYNYSDIDLNVKQIDNTTNQLFYKGVINTDIKAAPFASVLKGYEPGETYRFGIQFYDKQKNKKFVKWIGDIKMPEVDDTVPTGKALYEDLTTAPNTKFVPGFVANKVGINEAFVTQLYIEFEINIPQALSEVISGYSIVRVERQESDKTILGTGILTTIYDDGGSNFFLPDMQEADLGGGCELPFPYLNVSGPLVSGGSIQDQRFTLECPEFLLNTFPGFQSGDKIQVIARYGSTTAGSTTDTSISGGEPYRLMKVYDFLSSYDPLTYTYDLERAGWCDFGSKFQFSAGYTYNNFTRTTTTESDSIGSKTLCIELTSGLTHAGATFSILRTDPEKLLVRYYRPNNSQYGGNTYSARSRNEYIVCSHFRPIDSLVVTSITDTFKVFGGDVYGQVYDIQRGIKNWGYTFPDGSTRSTYTGGSSACLAPYSKKSITFFFPCTSSHNTGLRHGNYINRNLLADNGTGASAYETHEYNLVYSSENNIVKCFPKPLEFITNEEFDNRFYYSDVKISGETSDSWGVFRANNFYDVDALYGPINGMEVLNDNLIFLQDRAVGGLSINPVSQVQDQSGTAIVLGKGDVIQDHNYISNSIGTRHQHSIVKGKMGVYWIDTRNKGMYGIRSGSLQAVSEIKGMRSWFLKNLKGDVLNFDNPVYVNSSNRRIGILTGVDHKYSEILFTIYDKHTVFNGEEEEVILTSNTLCYNELTDSFTSFYSFKPYLYIYDSRFLGSFDTGNYSTNVPTGAQRLWIHDTRTSSYGNFYNAFYDSYIKLLVNPNPSIHKIFDNLHLQTEVLKTDSITEIEQDTGYGATAIHETFNKLRVTNDYQDTGIVNLNTGNLRRMHRYWKTYIPNDTTNSSYSSFKPRIRDFYMNLHLYFTNNNNKRLICHDILTEFRPAGSPISTN